MRIRKLHRAIGLVMLLPLFGWAITGLIFFLKPGYEGAYESLQPKTYPMEGQITITPNPAWLEVKYFRTILGNHLVVRTSEGWEHLDPTTLKLNNKPSTDEMKRLMNDAFTKNPGRYGQIVEITGEKVTTNTNVRVTVNWKSLSMSQRGTDTDLIDRLYKIHYLQWTGVKWIDRVFGAVGLILIAILSVLGFTLSINVNLVNVR